MKALEGGFALGQYTVILCSVLGKVVSNQAVSKRINKKTKLFFKAVLQKLISKKIEVHSVITKDIETLFPRILVQDSTNISLHNSLVKYFPGSSNQNGRSSCLKIQAAFNLMNSAFEYLSVTPYGTNDQKASRRLSFLKKGDLLIRDLGYFGLKQFERIIKKKAFFLSRLKCKVVVKDGQSGRRINMLKLLRNQNRIDMNVLLGADAEMPVRLIARKVPKSVAKKRVKEYKENRDTRSKPSEELMELAAWDIFITNIPKEKCSVETITHIYTLRWRIEIIFKSWKNCMNFKLEKETSAEKVLLLLYSRLIMATVLTSQYFSYYEEKVFKKSGKFLSIIKFIKLLVNNGEDLFPYMISKKRKDRTFFINILIRHSTYESRNRQNYTQKLILLKKAVKKKD